MKLKLLSCMLFCIPLSFYASTKTSNDLQKINIDLLQNNGNVGQARNINCGMTEAQIMATGTPSITFGGSKYYIGFRQVTSINQNPVLLKFTNGTLDWCREDYDTNTADVRGYGLFWSGTNLYAAFSIDGIQGNPANGITRFTGNGWLSSYGPGGGPSAAVILTIDPTDGAGDFGTFVYARLSNGNTNTLTVTDMFFDSGNLIVKADTFFSPLNTNQTPMTCTGGSPFDYTLVLSSNLETASCASAVNCMNSDGVDCQTVLNTEVFNLNTVNVYLKSDEKQLIINGQIETETKLNLYDALGRLQTSIILEKNVNNQNLGLSDLNSGIYIVKIESNSQEITKKVLL